MAGEQDSTRQRLEQQAAQILGKARADAAEVLRFAQAEAEGILRRAREHAEATRADAAGDREQARRELVEAQERALAIRSEAQRIAEGIIRRATRQARTEADGLLHEARLQLARAVTEMNEAQAAARAITEDAVVIDLRQPEPVVEITPRPTLVPVPSAAVMPSPPPNPTAGLTSEELREWVNDLSDENLDALIGSAVECAVARAISPIVVRAGRYTLLPRAV